MDTVDKPTRSRTMRAVKSKGNRSTEARLRALLARRGVRGWKVQAAQVRGSPDFIFPSERVAIFVDGCFWHGCPRCYRRPSSSRTYWDAKVQRTITRDNRNRARLRREGWSVLRLWEHALAEPDRVLARIHAALDRRRSASTRKKGKPPG